MLFKMFKQVITYLNRFKYDLKHLVYIKIHYRILFPKYNKNVEPEKMSVVYDRLNLYVSCFLKFYRF